MKLSYRQVKGYDRYFSFEKDLIEIYRLIHIYLAQKQKQRASIEQSGYLSDEANVQMLKSKQKLSEVLPKYLDKTLETFQEFREDEENWLFGNLENDANRRFEIGRLEDTHITIKNSITKAHKINTIQQWIISFHYVINLLHSNNYLAQGIWNLWAANTPEDQGYIGDYPSGIPDSLSSDMDPDPSLDEISKIEEMAKQKSGYWTSKKDWQIKASIINKLMKIANALDEKRFYKEASAIDSLTQREMLQTGIPLTFHSTPQFDSKPKNKAEQDYQQYMKQLNADYYNSKKI